MNILLNILFLIISFGIKNFLLEFVSIGVYPGYEDLDINHPLCGLDFVPSLKHDLKLPEKCFTNQMENKTFYSFESFDRNFAKKVSERVFKGHTAESPWTVLVLKSSGEYCTGVLITFQWVLTAAHCFPQYMNYRDRIVLGIGSERLKPIEEKDAITTQVYRHPKYTDPPINMSTLRPIAEGMKPKIERQVHDMALIKLFKPFTRHRSDGIKYLINTICLSQTTDVLNTGSEFAEYLGYGFVEQINQTVIHSDYLKKGSILLSPYSHCENSQMFCTSFPNPDDARPCEADSGGPLIQKVGSKIKRTVLIGTLRGSGPGRANCSSKILYANWVAVPKFVNWIVETIREHS